MQSIRCISKTRKYHLSKFRDATSLIFVKVSKFAVLNILCGLIVCVDSALLNESGSFSLSHNHPD